MTDDQRARQEVGDSRGTSPILREAIVHGLRGVLDFRGRDARAWYWPYAGAVLVSVIAFSNAVLIPVFAIEAWASSGAVDGGQHQIVWVFLGVTAAAAGLIVVLLAAATTRRLHDRGLRGAWAGVPAILLCSGLGFFAALTGSGDEPDLMLFAAGFVNNLVYFVALVLLVVQLVLPSKPGVNQYDRPDRTTG